MGLLRSSRTDAEDKIGELLRTAKDRSDSV